MNHNSFAKRVISYYKKVESIDRLIKKQPIIINFYKRLKDEIDDAILVPDSLIALDPKYILPNLDKIDLSDWVQRKFILGILFIEILFNKGLEELTSSDYVDDDSFSFNSGNEEVERDINSIIKLLLNPDNHTISDINVFNTHLKPVVFKILGLKLIDGLWVSPFFITKGLYLSFIEENSIWKRSSRNNKKDGNYLADFKSLRDDEPVREITGYSARAFCNWYSEQYKLPAFYDFENEDTIVQRKNSGNGFRLLTKDEHSRLLPDSFCHNDYDEVVDGGEKVNFYINGTYFQQRTWITSREMSAFRICVKEETI